MMNDPLANALSTILHHEQNGQKEVVLQPVSKVITKILDIMQEQSYVGKYETISEGKGGIIKLHLLGHINKCGVIKPRFAIQLADLQRYEKRFLPARNVGIMIISTPQGIMTHHEAKKKGHGGKLLAYIY